MAAAAEARIKQQQRSSTGTTTTGVVTDGASDSFIETKADHHHNGKYNVRLILVASFAGLSLMFG